MQRFEHGGDVYAHPGVLDFSSNLNPLGMPPAAVETLKAGVAWFARYPDPRCTELLGALAAFEQVPEDWVLPCAGATDAFFRLCLVLRPRKALVCAPCYSGYEQALEQMGAQVVVHELREEEGFDLGGIRDPVAMQDVGLVFLANPNNPTGRCLQRGVLMDWLAWAERRGAVLVLDECFIDLTTQRGSNDLLGRHARLVIVKALTKSFALAGLRVGYALCSDADLMGRLRAAGQPWAVSVPAQLAGVACLSEQDYLQRARELVRNERLRLKASLERLGLRVIDGEANYLLFKAETNMVDELLERGVLVRSCANYRCLDERWHRVAVRLPSENDQLVAALEEVLSCQRGL